MNKERKREREREGEIAYRALKDEQSWTNKEENWKQTASLLNFDHSDQQIWSQPSNKIIFHCSDT